MKKNLLSFVLVGVSTLFWACADDSSPAAPPPTSYIESSSSVFAPHAVMQTISSAAIISRKILFFILYSPFIELFAENSLSFADDKERSRGDRTYDHQNDPKPDMAVIAGLRGNRIAAVRSKDGELC